ncbi:MAG: serine protease AprX [Saprospiraceae bacterium]|jgi:serine protease AprX
MRIFYTLFFCCFFTFSFSQNKGELKKIWVEFADKANSEHTADQPEKFLSQRSIQRRHRQNITYDSTDLPVNKVYLEKLESLGATIHSTSKWLNAASVLVNADAEAKIAALNFVKSIKYVGKHLTKLILLRREDKLRDSLPEVFVMDNYYGHAEEQIKMLNGDFLHNQGFTGKDIWIAILDGGFSNVDIMPFFDSLRANNRLILPRDFVDGDEYVFESSSHGSQVLSTMAANYPGLMVGTAPDATYICLKTEDIRGEYLIEECNWVAGLEYADSLGVDVVNSSLGYTIFSDEKMNYSYEDLNGKTGIATRAASLAGQKGMIVVNSAGNEGDTEWKYIDIPADAENILTVGAVKSNLERARFSSVGPAADGRIKPEIVAMGQRVVTASVYGAKVNRSRGTSFSSPIIAGMVAALWQAFPNNTNHEIMQAIIQSSSQVDSPDNELGYGIPDFRMAYQFLKMKQ